MRVVPSPVLLVEILGLVAWLAMAGWAALSMTNRADLVPIDATALATGPSQERWVGIFFQDQHVGYAVSRATPATGGGMLYEERSSFRFATFGKLQEVVTAGAALTDEAGKLVRFDFFMAGDNVRLATQGEVRGRQVVMKVQQAGEVSELTLDVAKPPQVGTSLESVLRTHGELAVGQRITTAYFDPVTMADGEMVITVDDVEVLENGEEAYWLTRRFGDMETRALVTPAGDTLREEGGALGLSMVRMTPEEARDVPTTGAPVDLIALSAVKVKGRLPDARNARYLRVVVSGIDPARVPHQPPLQVREGDEVTVSLPLLAELPDLAVADTSEPEWLQSTLTLPATHREIQDRAIEVVGDATTRLEAVQRLNAFVYDYVEKIPSIGVPNGLEVLRTARGDCNEHTALFVSLARAAGIPTRIAAGVVYSDRVGDRGAFYYHAWPEVRLGGPTDWVPVDPTFGQVPADATHLKLVEGDLDRQVEIMGVMGRLALAVEERR